MGATSGGNLVSFFCEASSRFPGCLPCSRFFCLVPVPGSQVASLGFAIFARPAPIFQVASLAPVFLTDPSSKFQGCLSWFCCFYKARSRFPGSLSCSCLFLIGPSSKFPGYLSWFCCALPGQLQGPSSHPRLLLLFLLLFQPNSNLLHAWSSMQYHPP